MSDGRLDSWKQIAAYLNKSERTVRRWHEAEGLPVHKHQHKQKGTVWAYQAEIDAWLHGRTAPMDTAPMETATPAAPRRWPFWAAGVFAAGVLLLALRGGGARSVKPETSVVTALPGMEYGPSVSPDGSRVAFFWGPQEFPKHGIYVKRFDQEQVTPLILAEKHGEFWFLYNPAWSPDGRSIAYLGRKARTAETFLFVIPSAGGAPRQIAQIGGSGRVFFGNHNHLSWTPDGAAIVAPVAMQDRSGVFRFPVAGGEPERLTPPTDRFLMAPSISPDGRRLVYMVREGPPQAGIESVMLLDLKTAGEPVTLYHGQSMASGLAWSRTSDRLYFCNAHSALFGPFDSQIYLLSTTPGRAPELLPFGANCNTVSVAPNGDVLYGTGASTNTASRLWSATLGEPGPAAPFVHSSRYESLPKFSPDGRRVAFISNRSGPPEVWVADASGASPRRLTENGHPRSAPQWSPDGTRIVFAAAPVAAVRGIVVVPLDGGKPSRLAIDDEMAGDPVWSHDGDWIFYTSGQKLFRVRIDGTGRMLIEGETMARYFVQETADGSYLYYTRGGSAAELCRVPARGGKVEVVAAGLRSESMALGREAALVLTKEGWMWIPFDGSAPRRAGKAQGPQNVAILRTRLGMTVSPDGTRVIYAIGRSAELDLERAVGVR
ncbi:MAG: PD40 domain-containing protein [Bryobacterales bacterium]|nr:PD40 domain-containing protein [Bryobacterales bacterium]